MEQEKLIKEFLNKGWGMRGDWTDFWKSYKKNWYNGKMKWQHLKHTQSFFFFNLFIHKLDIIRKEYVIWLHIFSAAVLPNVIKISQHLTE